MKTKTQFMNRILSLVLSIMMVVSMLPMNILTANAAETTESAIDLSTLTETYLISDSGEIFSPAPVAMESRSKAEIRRLF